MITLGVSILTFLAGTLLGNRLTWWWMEREWRRYPAQFKYLVDRAVEKRSEVK